MATKRAPDGSEWYVKGYWPPDGSGKRTVTYPKGLYGKRTPAIEIEIDLYPDLKR